VLLRRLGRGAGIPARAGDIAGACPEAAEGIAMPRLDCGSAALCYRGASGSTRRALESYFANKSQKSEFGQNIFPARRKRA